MKAKRHLLTFITLVAIVTLISFAHLASAQRGRAFVAHTANATAPDDSFSPKDHVIYCIVDAPNAKPNATYKFVWGRHDAAHSSPQTIFQDEVTYQSGSRVVSKFRRRTICRRAITASTFGPQRHTCGRLSQSSSTRT